MEDWKELNLKDLPNDLFSGKYEVEVLNTTVKQGQWMTFEINTPEQMGNLIISLNLEYLKHRYRLKPLETIRITRELLNHLKSDNLKYGLTLPENEKDYKYGGRPMEIID